MNTKIINYDRSKRNWIYSAPDGSKVSFPSGVAGKTEAYMLRLKDESPKVRQMLQHLETKPIDPSIMRRAFDGSILLINNHVMKPCHFDDENILARVASASQPIDYKVFLDEAPRSIYFCTCPDMLKAHEIYDLFGGNTPANPSMENKSTGTPYLDGIGYMCKHTWAYHFSTLINHPLASDSPHPKKMAVKLWAKVQKILLEHPDVKDHFKDCQPMIVSRGEFSIAMPDEIIKLMKNQKSLYKLIKDLVSDATMGSQQLVVE